MNEIRHGHHEINRIADELHVDHRVRDMAKDVYDSAYQRQTIKGRSVEDIAAASIYIAARNLEFDVDFLRLADSIGIAGLHLGLILDDIPPRPWRENTPDAYIDLLTVELVDNDIYVDTSMRRMAMEILEDMDTEGKELECAGAALAYAIEQHAGPPAVLSVCEISKAKPSEILRRYEGLHETNNDRRAA